MLYSLAHFLPNIGNRTPAIVARCSEVKGDKSILEFIFDMFSDKSNTIGDISF